MDNAFCLANIFGPFMLIIGLWKLIYSDNLMKVWMSIKTSPACFFFAGVVNLFMGISILTLFSTWSLHLSVLVTLLGWVLLFRGFLALFIPQLLVQLTMTNRTVMKYIGVVPLIWGLALSWFAFFM